MLNETGILLLAIGHPYYGRMAYNLAMSIKAIDKNTSITLAYTDNAIAHINHRNMWVFDNKMLLEADSQPFGVKLNLYELTPYARTLYMDVDTLWVNKNPPRVLFESLKGISFTGITEGFHDYSAPHTSEPNKNYFFWADLEEIKKIYPLEYWVNPVNPKIYQWRSEFMYFEKNSRTDDFFNTAKEIYANPKMNSVKMFAGNIPDELAINISAAINGVHPHKYKWMPTYWDKLNGGNMPDIEALQANYYVISCGSNANSSALKRVYDRVASASAYKLKLQHVFPLISKKEMLTNRQLM